MCHSIVVATLVAVLCACQQTEPGAARKASGAAPIVLEGVKGEAVAKEHEQPIELEKRAPTSRARPAAREGKWYVPE